MQSGEPQEAGVRINLSRLPKRRSRVVHECGLQTVTPDVRIRTNVGTLFKSTSATMRFIGAIASAIYLAIGAAAGPFSETECWAIRGSSDAHQTTDHADVVHRGHGEPGQGARGERPSQGDPRVVVLLRPR
jgi:hypothetical protein